jgi:hypothetical protein
MRVLGSHITPCVRCSCIQGNVFGARDFHSGVSYVLHTTQVRALFVSSLDQLRSFSSLLRFLLSAHSHAAPIPSPSSLSLHFTARSHSTTCSPSLASAHFQFRSFVRSLALSISLPSLSISILIYIHMYYVSPSCIQSHPPSGLLTQDERSGRERSVTNHPIFSPRCLRCRMWSAFCLAVSSCRCWAG